MKSFAAATLLAIASAQFSDVTHPEDTRVDLNNSTKFIGRIAVFEDFDEWVNEQRIEGALLDINKNPCLFQYICADGVNKPFVFSDDEALYVNHNCPHTLVHKIRFDTTLEVGSVKKYHEDAEVRLVDDSEADRLTIKSWLNEKRDLIEGETEYPTENDDGFLFDGLEPAWSYAYHVCLSSDDLSSEFCKRPEDQGPDPEPQPQENNCGKSEDELKNRVFSTDFTGDRSAYQVGCYTWPLDWTVSGQAGIRFRLAGNVSDSRINSLDVTIVNTAGEELLKSIGSADPEGTVESQDYTLALDFSVYLNLDDGQKVAGVDGDVFSTYPSIGDVSDMTYTEYIDDLSYGVESIVWLVDAEGKLAGFAPTLYGE